MLLLLFSRQPAAPSPELINMSGVVADLMAPLNAAGAQDLIFWTQDELYIWIDEAAERLARIAGVNVVRDETLTSVLDQGPYALPVTHLATIQADLAGVVLQPAAAHEIEARDSDWLNTLGTPSRFVMNTNGTGVLVLYPAPDADSAPEVIGLVMMAQTSAINSAAPYLSAPGCLREYFSFSALGEARAKETKAAMPEVAQWMRGLAGIYEQVIQQYWGAGL